MLYMVKRDIKDRIMTVITIVIVTQRSMVEISSEIMVEGFDG